MTLDPATLCARTAAGEAEIAVATNGLSLSQRRVLSLLEDPAAFDELAARQRMERVKLSRDLTRLAELRLIVLQEPSARIPATEASPNPAGIEARPVEVPAPLSVPVPAVPPGDGSVPANRPSMVASPSPVALVSKTRMDPVVIGSGSRRSAATYAIGGGVALAIGVGIWVATRTAEPAPNAAMAAAPIAAPQTQPTPITTEAATAPAQIPSNTTAREPVGAADAKRDVRSALLPPPAAAAPKAMPESSTARTVAATASHPAEPAPIASATPVPAVSVAAAPMAAPPAPAAPAPVANPLPVAASAPTAPPAPVAAAAEATPPVVLAAAAPQSSPAPKPAVPAALKVIQREQPVFPREAIAAGIETGNVKARLHVDATGNVTAVDILSAQPQRVFDRAVRGALQRWQFEPGPGTRTTDVDVAFQRN